MGCKELCVGLLLGQEAFRNQFKTRTSTVGMFAGKIRCGFHEENFNKTIIAKIDVHGWHILAMFNWWKKRKEFIFLTVPLMIMVVISNFTRSW